MGSFLPWLESGERSRSSYELYGVVSRLEVASGSWARVGLAVWPLVPLLVTSAAVLAWWGRAVSALVAAWVAAAYVGVICVVAWRAPLPARLGVPVTFVGALALAAAAGALAWRRPV